MNIILLGPTWRNAEIAVYLTKRGHNVMQSNEQDMLRCFDEGLSADIVISNGYAPIFKPHHVNKMNIINIHPAALPRGRGIYPNVWALYEGTAIGVCIHQIDEGIDTGDLLASDYMQHWELDYRLGNPQETLQTFYTHLLRRVENLFYHTWPSIEDGSILPYKQEPGGFRHYRNRMESNKLMKMFPDRWDTPIKLVKLAGEHMRKMDEQLHFGC